MPLIGFFNSPGRLIVFNIKALFLWGLISLGHEGIAYANKIVITSNINWSAAGINSSDSVVVENGATLTVNIDSAVCANMQLGSNLNGSLNFFNASSKLTITRDLLIGQVAGADGSLDMTFGSLFIGRSFSRNTSNSVFNSAGGTVEFKGVGSGNISGGFTGSNAFNIIIFDSLGSWIIQSDLDVKSNFNISNNCVVSLNAAKKLIISGNFSNVTGATFDATNAFVTINGNMTNTGSNSTFNAGLTTTVSGNWTTSAGATFDPDSLHGGTVIFNGSGPQTLNNGATSLFYNVIDSCSNILQLSGNRLKIIHDLTIAPGCTLKTNGERITISGSWSNNNGTFIADNDTVFFSGNNTFNHTISGKLTGSSPFVNLFFTNPSGNGSWIILDVIYVTDDFKVEKGHSVKSDTTFTVDSNVYISGIGAVFECAPSVVVPNFIVNGDLNIDNNGQFVGANSIIVVKGDWKNFMGDFIHNNSTVRFNGTASREITSNTKPFFKIAHNTTADLNLKDPLYADGDIFFPNGTGDLYANSHNISIKGNWNVESDFFPGSATQTVNFNGSNYQSLLTKSPFQNLTHNSTSKLTVFPNNGTLNILNDLKNNSGGTFELDTNHVTLTVGHSLENSDSTTIFHSGPLLTINGHFENKNKATFVAGAIITVDSNWINASNALFLHGSGTVKFTGTALQNIDNGTSPFFNFTNLNSSGSVILSTNTDIAGDFVNSLGTTCNANGKNIQINGDWTNSGTFIANGTAQTVIFNGSTTQLVNSGSSDFQNLTHNAPNTLQLVANNLVVNGGLINSAGVFDALTSNINVAVNGNFTNDSASYKSGTSMILAGNWINNGTFDPGTGTSMVTFSGTTQQNISGSSVTTFKKVKISNDVNLTGIDIRIASDLEFSGPNNLITTNTNTVILDSVASVTNAGQTNGYINGNESVIVKTNTGVVTNFIIGDTSVYAPVSVKFNGATSGAGYLTAYTQAGGSPNENNPVVNSSGIDQLKKVKRYWNLSNQNVVFSDFDATFNFNSSDLTSTLDTGKVVVRKFNSGSGNWQTTTPGLKTLLSAQCKNNTGFGEFEIGEKGTISVGANPADIIICEGFDTSLIVVTPSRPVPAVQWERDDNAGGGFQAIGTGTDGGVYGNSYNTDTLTLTNATFSLDGFLYRARLTNINGVTVTTNAKIKVDQSVSISGQPGSLVLCADSIAQFTVIATGPGITYQWYKDGVILPGETQNSLTLSSVVLNDSGNYYCFVSAQGTCPPKQSDVAKLNVKAQPPIPSISSALLDSISPFCSGTSNISFILDYVDPSYNFLWYSTSNPPLIIQDSLHSAVISAPISGGGYQGNIHVVYTNSINCTSQATFVIDVKQDVAPETAPVILKQPGNLLVYLDNSVDQYTWGYDRPSDLMPDTIEGQVYQAFVPDSTFLVDDPNTAELNDMILNTKDFYFWVGVKEGECATKVYYNGPYAKKSPDEITPDTPYDISMNVAPNPSQGQFEVTLSGNIYGAIELIIVNTLGETMAILDVTKSEGVQKFNFNVHGLPAGLYFIKLKGEQNQQLAIKLLIK